ncbi:MAG: hypothetical protein NDI94_02355 [Candidatus Woesearchaeota archaeon]|nr:hypothetical protein [Candidatus Woesearchaeota archaeon]
MIPNDIAQIDKFSEPFLEKIKQNKSLFVHVHPLWTSLFQNSFSRTKEKSPEEAIASSIYECNAYDTLSGELCDYNELMPFPSFFSEQRQLPSKKQQNTKNLLAKLSYLYDAYQNICEMTHLENMCQIDSPVLYVMPHDFLSTNYNQKLLLEYLDIFGENPNSLLAISSVEFGFPTGLLYKRDIKKLQAGGQSLEEIKDDIRIKKILSLKEAGGEFDIIMSGSTLNQCMDHTQNSFELCGYRVFTDINHSIADFMNFKALLTRDTTTIMIATILIDRLDHSAEIINGMLNMYPFDFSRLSQLNSMNSWADKKRLLENEYGGPIECMNRLKEVYSVKHTPYR